jgi:hypothetical protein
MPNFNQSTQEMVGFINAGLTIRTSVLNNTDVLKVASTDIFKVYGRIRILSLDVEAITEWSADATTLKFQFDASVPAVAAADISAASLAVTSLAAGKRVVWQGTALNTALVIAASPCISLQSPNTMDVGCYDGVGTINITGAAAAQTSGTCRFTLCYVPLTDGAYAEPLL